MVFLDEIERDAKIERQHVMEGGSGLLHPHVRFSNILHAQGSCYPVVDSELFSSVQLNVSPRILGANRAAGRRRGNLP